MRRRIAAVVVAGVLPFASCGGDNPNGPSSTPGGTVAGRYILEIRPGPTCSVARGPHTFPMSAVAAGTSPYPGVQVVVDGVSWHLEAEFKYTDFTLRGGLGTTGLGVLTNEGLRFWIRAIGTGAVAHQGDGVGEVSAGTLMGYLATGSADGEEAAAAACVATDHTFTLKAR